LSLSFVTLEYVTNPNYSIPYSLRKKACLIQIGC